MYIYTHNLYSISYVHIDFNARSKLDAKSKICFFIGYGDEKFGYRFWDEQNKILSEVEM